MTSIGGRCAAHYIGLTPELLAWMPVRYSGKLLALSTLPRLRSEPSACSCSHADAQAQATMLCTM